MAHGAGYSATQLGAASPQGLAYRITDRGRRAAAPDEVPEDFAAVMTRLGPVDLATVDTLIAASIWPGAGCVCSAIAPGQAVMCSDVPRL